MHATPDIALLSVKPDFVRLIFSGEKRVEFRRRALARSVRYVVVYATLPEGRIAGICRVTGIRQATPARLWREVGSLGAISRDAYDGYFEGAECAYAIELADATPFEPESLVTLGQLGASRPPQSFQYVREAGRARLLALVP